MTTTKMRHKTVALLLLIIIAFSNASCNFVGELEITENDASQVIGSTENKAEDKTENETEKATEIKNWHGAVEYDENMAKEIQNEYYSQIVPEEITRDPSKYEVQFIAKFADKYVVYIYDIHRDKGRMSAIDIGGFEFRYWRQNEIYVYESGVFTTLPEALEKKELSNDDLAATNAHFRRLNARRYKEIPTLLENERICTEYIAVGIQPSYNDKTYTVSDFPELKGVTEINQANGVKQPGDIAVSLHIMVENYSEQDIIDALWKLYERDDVLYARAGYYGTVDESPNDTYYVNSHQWAIDKIKLLDAWDLVTGSSTVRVGVIDSGIDITHPDLAGRVNTTLSKSYSTPMVAGVAALMLAKNSSYTNIQIKNKILDSVDTIVALQNTCVTGGRLNAHKAVCVHNSSNIQYTPTTTGLHIMTCVVCNYSKTTQHMYMYTSLNSTQHRVYCVCGYSADESHNKITDSNKGEIYCTKCSYRLELWNIKDEHELQ